MNLSSWCEHSCSKELSVSLSYPSFLPTSLSSLFSRHQLLVQNFLLYSYKEDSSQTLASQQRVLLSSGDSHPPFTNCKLHSHGHDRDFLLSQNFSVSDHTLLTHFLIYHLIRASGPPPHLVAPHLAILPVLTLFSNIPTLPPPVKLLWPRPLTGC